MTFRLAIKSRIPSYPTARLQADFKAAVQAQDADLDAPHPDGRDFAWADIEIADGSDPFERTKAIVRAMSGIADYPRGSTLLVLESESRRDLMVRLEMIETAEARYGIDLSTPEAETA